jgi:predicted lactoylglutathione lyase
MKDNKKDVKILICLTKEKREEFKQLCNELDTSMSVQVNELITEFINKTK